MAVETKELTVIQPDITQLQTTGKIFYESGMFPDVKSAAQAIVKIQAGFELGFSPIYSMTKVYIVSGRVMVAAEMLGAMVKRSGRYDYRVKTLTDAECELVFTDAGADVYASKFTMDDAKRAGLIKPGSGWEKYPRAMLMSKALSQGARIVCPHIISGAYTPEDFGYSTDPENGRVVDIPENPRPKVVVESPAPKMQTSEASEETPIDFDKQAEPLEPATPEQLYKIKQLRETFNVDAIVKDLGIKARTPKELTKAQANMIIGACSPADAKKMI